MNKNKFFRSVSAFCALILLSGVSAKAENAISVADVTSTTLDSPSVFIGLDNDDDFTAIQFDLKLSNDRIGISDEITLNSGRLNDHTISVKRRDDGSIRVVIGSLSNSLISNNDEYMVEARLSVADSTAQTGTLTISNIIATNETGTVVKMDPCSSNVTFFHPEFSIKYLVDGVLTFTDSVHFKSNIIVRQEPTKEGYTFSGWSEIPATMPAHDVVVTGSFSINKYLLTYMVDGETYSSDSIAYGTPLAAIDAPEKEGYSFSGWSEIPATMPAHDVAVTGSFSINKYLLTYMVDGEVYQSDSIVYNASIVPLDAPEKEGYIFEEWIGLPDFMPAYDVTVSASFKIIDGITGIEMNSCSQVFDLTGKFIGEMTDDELHFLKPGIYIVNNKKLFVQ